MGLLSVCVAFDVLGLCLGSPIWRDVGFWNIAAGLVTAAPAVVSGLADFAAQVRGPRPERLATVHMTLMLSALGAFGMSLVFRRRPELSDWSLRLAAMAIDCLGTLLLAAGGWFGGELVYDHAVGVRQSGETAHPRATYILTIRAANRQG
jgi:uncharacterized membrane protein